MAVYTSSPQEQEEFCHVNEVMASIDTKIAQSESKDCKLMILPFTLGTNLQRRVNAECIERPVEILRRRKIAVHLIYLRKERARELEELDALMQQLSEKTISSDEDYDRQARELLRSVDEIDP